MEQIVIIKLGAKGDVVRTLSLLPALKKKFPSSKISWITKKNTVDLLQGNPYLDEVISPPIKIKSCDILYSLDFDEEASALAESITAKKKYGFYNEGGYAAAFNPGAEYYVNTMFDDTLKKENKKTYQEMIFAAAEIPYKGESGTLMLDNADKKYAENFIKDNSLRSNKIIGIHMGASDRWPSKVWSQEKMKEFIKTLKAEGYDALVFGGPLEVEKQEGLIAALASEGVSVVHNDPKNTDKQFAALVDCCKAMICSDSFALHISLTLKKPTIALFFCTSPNEIEGYGVLHKIISPMLYDFFPEKQDQYSEELVNSIPVEEVVDVIKQL